MRISDWSSDVCSSDLARLAEAGLQCPAPADFLAPAAAPAAPAATTPAGQRRVATARREVEVSRARVAIEQRHGNGRPLHYQPLPAAHAAAAAPGAFSAPPSRAAVSNAVTTFFDGSSGDDPDGFAAITGPSTSGFPDTPSMGGMSSPQRVTLPRPSLAIRALGNMSYGATASDRKSTRLNSSH